MGLLAATMLVPAQADARLMTKPKCDTLDCRKTSQLKNLKHARYVCNNGARYPKRWSCSAVKWLKREYNETLAALAPKVEKTGAWAWYLTPATQCVTNHEGAWTSVNSAGYYGRFQMDVPFQNETAYGRAAYRRWGTADHWPPAVQVQHAYSIWSYAGWSRWPTYARYCS